VTADHAIHATVIVIIIAIVMDVDVDISMKSIFTLEVSFLYSSLFIQLHLLFLEVLPII